MAMYDFGLSKDDFYTLTPAQFSAISKRHEERLRLEDLQASYTRCVIAAPNRKKGSPAPKPIDFALLTVTKENAPERTPQQLFSFVKGILHPMLEAKNKERGNEIADRKQRERDMLRVQTQKQNEQKARGQ